MTSTRLPALAAIALATAVCLAPAGVALAPTVPPTSDASGSPVAGTDPVASLGLSELSDVIETIDEFLETVLDLVRTVNAIFGEGEAAGEAD